MSDTQARRVLEEAEAVATPAMERLVASDSFGEVLARVVQQVSVAQRASSGSLDLIVRTLRLAGRQDTARIGRQLGRAEDKLERVLQEIHVLQQARQVDPAAPEVMADSQAHAPRRWRAGLGGASAVAVLAAAILLALHPPVVRDIEQALAVAAGAVALVLAGAWGALGSVCRAQERVRR